MVQFDVANSPQFSVSSGVQEYDPLGLKLCFNIETKLLTAIQVDLGTDVGGEEELLREARDKIAALLAFIEFQTGSPIRLGGFHISGIQSKHGAIAVTSSVSCDAVLSPPALVVPSEKGLTGLSESTELRLQLLWFNRGRASSWVVDRIRTLYGVLEIEIEQGPGGKPPAGSLWEELKNVRDAASHAFLEPPGNFQLRDYLQRNINSTRLHFDNDSHMDFLRKKAQVLEDEARNLLLKKLGMV